MIQVGKKKLMIEMTQLAPFISMVVLSQQQMLEKCAEEMWHS